MSAFVINVRIEKHFSWGVELDTFLKDLNL